MLLQYSFLKELIIILISFSPQLLYYVYIFWKNAKSLGWSDGTKWRKKGDGRLTR